VSTKQNRKKGLKNNRKGEAELSVMKKKGKEGEGGV